jgi:hypothetical protein
MFHGKKFLANISKKAVQDKCSKYAEIDAGHWMMHQNLEAVMAEVRSFIRSTDQQK